MSKSIEEISREARERESNPRPVPGETWLDRGEECSGTAQLPADPKTWRNHVVVRGACPDCGKDLATTSRGFVRSHKPKKTSR